MDKYLEGKTETKGNDGMVVYFKIMANNMLLKMVF